jgi:NAD+ synthase (glutamine-hydrolysing)
MNTRQIRLALVQMNSTVGALEENSRKIIDALRYARNQRADVVAFPELALCGYPPEDLLHAPRFLRACRAELEKIIPHTAGLTALIGFPDLHEDPFNAAAIVHDGKLIDIVRKHYLPNYGVFDEDRYFQRGHAATILERRGIKIGVSICEDIWYPDGPPAFQALHGDAELLINLSASPYERGKRNRRRHMLETRALDFNAMVAFVNMVGGQDDLVFDGGSLVCNARGGTEAEAQAFTEGVLVFDCMPDAVLGNRLHDPRRRKARQEKGDKSFELIVHALPEPKAKAVTRGKTDWKPAEFAEPLSDEAEVYEALVLGLRDYVGKNRFHSVIIGLSGGIDSALTAAIAVDALGSDRVFGVTLPSRFSSDETRNDALLLAKQLGIRCDVIPIEGSFQALLTALKPTFKKLPWNEAEENLQARIRGTLLMAISNKLGPLVLTTGNKSEVSVGYATLYGDMAGGFNVLKDVYKTFVYRLARYRNTIEPVIPAETIDRPPTAELRHNQKDQDSLPPYDLLDAILQCYVEDDLGIDDIVGLGYAEKVVRRVIGLVDRNEYKRRQAAPGIKITGRAFGRDRRLPITNRFQS